ncbi:MAG: glutathione S-transferase N-terminal domain-containing protein [Lachnospiraceae bacterium]|nr:glutathione S-transferase N-terminal domain-containing protein [Lachnospiraceae bacterium]
MKTVKLFHLNGCPYCRQAFRALDELKKENAAYGEVPINMYEEYEDAEVVAKHDYYYAPTMYIGDDKIYEAHPGESYAECKAQVKKVLDQAMV